MPYCVHCGASVAAGTEACPACGRPPLATAAAPPPPRAGMSKGAIVAIIAALGCLPAIVVVGIVSALIIPNFIDALQKAKVKRTVVDLSDIQTTLLEYAYDTSSGDPPSARPLYPDVTTITELAAALAPHGEIARVDGWKRPFRYACARAAVGVGCNEFRIVSAGSDGVFEHEDPWHYEPGTIETGDYDADIVIGSGGFVRAPGVGPPGTGP